MKPETKNMMKQMLTLEQPILVNLYADKLKKYATSIYVIALGLMTLTALSGFVFLFRNISTAFLTWIMVVVEFVIVRMFCEFLISRK